MKGLAWDDNIKKRSYMNLLGESLRDDRNIELKLTSSDKVFAKELNNGPWDFIVLDLVKEGPSKDEEFGIKLARRILNLSTYPDLPIFIITDHYDTLSDDYELPLNVRIRSKGNPPHWMSQEISRAIRFKDRKKVFLIATQQSEESSVASDLIDYLKKHGLKVVNFVPGEELQTTLSKMRESCAYVVISNSDDLCVNIDQVLADDYDIERLDESKLVHFAQPDQRVLYAAGLATGVSGGDQGLVFLQRWGDLRGDRARLDLNIPDEMVIQFHDEIGLKELKSLREKLQRLNVDLS